MKDKKVFSENFILATLPALAYAMAFAYEFGFASFYGIPVEFISISVTQVFIATTAILTLSFLLLLTTNIIYQLLPALERVNPIHRRLIVVYSYTVFLLALIILYGFEIQYLFISLAMVVIVLFTEFIFPLITQRGKGRYKEKLEAQDNLDSQTKTLTDTLFEKFGNVQIKTAAFCILLLILSYLAGDSSAVKKKVYLVNQESESSLLLRVYGELFIFGAFDEATLTIKSLSLVKVPEGGPIQLTLKKLGNLNRTSKN